MKKNSELFVKVLGILKEKNLTQKDLAQEIGITPAALSKILSGKFLTKITTAQKISKALDVPLSYLMDNSSKTDIDFLKNSKITEDKIYTDIGLIIKLVEKQSELIKKINENIEIVIKLLKKTNKIK